MLKPGGVAILQVPISLSLPTTYEDPGLTTSSEREQAFGQADHVRIYGRDYRSRLEQVGFTVRIHNITDDLGEDVAYRYGVSKDEDLYICSKRQPAP